MLCCAVLTGAAVYSGSLLALLCCVLTCTACQFESCSLLHTACSCQHAQQHQTCHIIFANAGASTTATGSQALHHAPADAAAVKLEPKSPTAPAGQHVTGTAAATQPAVQASSTAVAQAGMNQEPASVTQTPDLQAQPTQEAVQTQAINAVQQPGSMPMPGNELTQAYEPVFQPDPWNALEIMWDSDTPPGWPKLICPWQVGIAYQPLDPNSLTAISKFSKVLDIIAP